MLFRKGKVKKKSRQHIVIHLVETLIQSLDYVACYDDSKNADEFQHFSVLKKQLSVSLRLMQQNEQCFTKKLSEVAGRS